MRIQNIENVNVALKYLEVNFWDIFTVFFLNKRKDHNVQLASISAENIVDGDLKLILGTIWTIILRFQIAGISEEGTSVEFWKIYHN